MRNIRRKARLNIRRSTRKILSGLCYFAVALIMLVVIIISSNKKACGIDLPEAETFTTIVFVETAHEDTEAECTEPERDSTTESATATIETDPVEPEPEEVSPVTTEALGEFTITYYCSCAMCCDDYAYNRPVVNGTEIVFTATGAVAQDGVTVAVDPTKIPYGTVLYIEGLGYRIAQDCGGAIRNNRIDVYVDSHETALENGMHTAQVYIMNELNS